MNDSSNSSYKNSGQQGRRSFVVEGLDMSSRSVGSAAGSVGSTLTATTANTSNNNNNKNTANHPSSQANPPDPFADFAIPISPQQQQQRQFQMQIQQHQLQLQQLQRQNHQRQTQQQQQQHQQQQASPANSYAAVRGNNNRRSSSNSNSGVMMNTTGGAPNQSSHTSIGTRTNSDENNTAFAIPPQSNNARLLQQQPQPSGRNYLPLAAPPVTTAASVPLLTQAASSMANTLNASTINQQSHTPALHSPDSMALQQQQLTSEQVLALLSKCNWIDKTVWASRQLLGGQSVNGFLKATATVQRIKKQRARQSAKTAHTSRKAGEAESTGSLEEQQAEEEVLKKEIMNARTAKKIKTELDGGIQFCALLHDTIRNILLQMDPSIPRIEPLNSRSGPSTTVTRQLSGFKQGALNAAMTAAPSCSLPPPTPLSQRQTTSPSSMTSPSSAGNSSGSTLRRYRKTKLPPSSEPLLEIPEFDDLTGKRVCTKKEHTLRVSEMLRFRVLRRGDPVAARVSSRDLWILARVVKDYPGTNMTSADFLRLSETRREQVFKDKVLIQDVEEHDGGAAAAVLVSRVLVLPLPRNVSEAAEWGTHYRFFKKGSRVYAMYPQTTSLYTATVVDCATYCRGDEDIIVVEFDGDEPDAATGRIPACHIPARFVTLIPREFLCAPTVATGSGSTSGKKRRSSPDNDSANPDPMSELLDDMAFDGDLPGLDNFDDLDFDLLGDS